MKYDFSFQKSQQLLQQPQPPPQQPLQQQHPMVADFRTSKEITIVTMRTIMQDVIGMEVIVVVKMSTQLGAMTVNVWIQNLNVMMTTMLVNTGPIKDIVTIPMSLTCIHIAGRVVVFAKMRLSCSMLVQFTR